MVALHVHDQVARCGGRVWAEVTLYAVSRVSERVFPQLLRQSKLLAAHFARVSLPRVRVTVPHVGCETRRLQATDSAHLHLPFRV